MQRIRFQKFRASKYLPFSLALSLSTLAGLPSGRKGSLSLSLFLHPVNKLVGYSTPSLAQLLELLCFLPPPFFITTFDPEVYIILLCQKISDSATEKPIRKMYPRLTVRSQDDPITEEEDSNLNKSDEMAIESLSPMANECLKSPVKQGNNSENRPNTPCATPSKSLSKSHPVSFTSTPVKTAEKSGKNTGDKTDRPNLFLRPRAAVSSRDNDDLIALQNRRIEKKAPRVKKCYINSAPNRKEKDENKNLGSVPVSATKTQDQQPSTGKRKEASATRRNVAIIARPT